MSQTFYIFLIIVGVLTKQEKQRKKYTPYIIKNGKRAENNETPTY